MFSTRDPIGNLFEGAAEAGLAWKEKSIQRREQKEFDTRVRAAYEKALAQAKVTGEMASEFQQKIDVDFFVSQVGVKTVAIRELQKKDPAHPLVTSQNCRTNIARATRINFNLANRPDLSSFAVANCAPSDEGARKIFESSK